MSSGGFSGIPEAAKWPLMAWITSSVASNWAYGPSWPKSVSDSTKRCSNSAEISRGSSLSGPSVPGLVDSIHTSALANSSRSWAWPSAVVTSTVMPRLLKLRKAKYRLVSPSGVNGGMRRESAPPGGSTRITSAPKSASNRPANSPLTSAMSMTRRPLSGSSLDDTKRDTTPSIHAGSKNVVN